MTDPGRPVRLPPLRREEWDDDQRALLEPLVLGEVSEGAPPGEPAHVFSTLARHPALFRRWLGFAGRLLQRRELPARDSELLILRAAALTGADYEWGHHSVLGEAAGLTPEEVARVAAGPDAGWSGLDRTLLRAADELLGAHRLGDETWAGLTAAYDEHQVMEVVFTVGAYAMLAGALNSFGTPLEPGYPRLPEPGAS